MGPLSLARLVRPRPVLAAEVWPPRAMSKQGRSDLGVSGPVTVVGVGRAFQGLTLVTVLSIFALVTLGGVVRLTESGLGCPDWPLCHGKIVPPMDTSTLIEYSHRLMATVVGLLVLATALIVWRSHRRRHDLVVPATLGLVLLVVQVLLGGFTVMRELSSGLVLAHLATAEALMASMLVVCIVALRRPSSSGYRRNEGQGPDGFLMLTVGAVLGAYLLLLLGSYVAVSGSATACGQSWPLCQGQLLPEGYNPMVHMVHRIVALLVGLLIAAVLIMAWRRKHERPALGPAAVGVGGLFLVQVLVGAAVLWMEFPVAARVLHLAMATLVWGALAVLAVLAYTPSESGLGSISRD